MAGPGKPADAHVAPSRGGSPEHPRWDTEEWQDIDAWARSCAELFWRSYGQDPGESGIPFLADTLRRFAEAFAPEPFDTRVLLRMWEPTSMPLQVFTVVRPAQGDREEMVRFLVGAEDQDAIEPPVVESFHAELLGAGLRAFRYLRQEDTPEVLAALRSAWREKEVGAGVVLWTATPCGTGSDTARRILGRRLGLLTRCPRNGP
ncbi:hypothetical protein [Streptomyces sp. R41]|uniref:Uncharacterized protein n=1 Tax=Streptomyces sp. R41 TaxID=3238632 RepID=A0AB39RS89_9ACTN